MKFSYQLIPQLSPLAWVARVLPDTSTISVSHGRFVETHPHFFVEGAWAGDFEAGRLHDADTVFGSGGDLAEACATFVSCTATTDFLYHGDDSGNFVIANSLPLLLAVLGDALQPGCADYSRINHSILGGIREYRSPIPTLKGHVSRVMHSNVQFGPDGIALVEKPLPPRFRQFGEYRDFMRNRIEALFANARHPARQKPMRIFSTQSKGYDSTAVNALAAPFRIDQVFTSPQSKERRSFYLGDKASLPSDDGAPVGEALGFACTPIDRLGFRENLVNEHLYWAGLDNNQDLNLHGIQSYISQPTLLLTGNLGEIWYTSEAIGPARLPTVNDELIRWDQAGHGLSEVRLAAGMVQVAAPFIGARNRRDILDITKDAAMDEFRLGGGYDRPIARRIAEEAGVPRGMFGQTKLASIVHMPTPNVPVTPALRAEFFRHLRSNRLLGRVSIGLLPLAQRLNNWIYWNKPSRYFSARRRHPLLWAIGYGWAKLFGRPLHIRMLWQQLDSYLYAFCVNKARNDYAGQLAAPHTAGDEADARPIPPPVSGVQE
ncbi:MAG: hypothetical protein Q8K12_03380 [Thiobacillus sp.]|nr:hypothetical protein [Thiobacillus sp.]